MSLHDIKGDALHNGEKITPDMTVKELEREHALRMNVYPGRVEQGKMPLERAFNQVATLLAARNQLKFLATFAEPIREAFQIIKKYKLSPADLPTAVMLLVACREKPKVVGVILDDPRVTEIFKHFPDAQIAALRDVATNMPANDAPKQDTGEEETAEEAA